MFPKVVLWWKGGGALKTEEISYVPVVNDPKHCQFTRYDIKS